MSFVQKEVSHNGVERRVTDVDENEHSGSSRMREDRVRRQHVFVLEEADFSLLSHVPAYLLSVTSFHLISLSFSSSTVFRVHLSSLSVC